MLPRDCTGTCAPQPTTWDVPQELQSWWLNPGSELAPSPPNKNTAVNTTWSWQEITTGIKRKVMKSRSRRDIYLSAMQQSLGRDKRQQPKPFKAVKALTLNLSSTPKHSIPLALGCLLMLCTQAGAQILSLKCSRSVSEAKWSHGDLSCQEHMITATDWGSMGWGCW